MDNLAKRLKAARLAKDFTQVELAKRSGVKQSDISKLERGDTLKTTAVLALARALDCDANWLDTGDGAPAFLHSHTLQSSPSSEGREKVEALTIQQFDTGGAMGHGLVLQDQPGVIRSWTVSPDWIKQNVHRITGPKNLAIVTGFGDSMRPLYNPGDPLLIDTGVTRADIDGIFFFRVGDEGFVKRLQRIPTMNGMVIRAMSDNQKYAPFDILKGMDFQVFGRVVKAWQGTDF
jgi:phage repressor protein C with HTH and peptisase S24 domain